MSRLRLYRDSNYLGGVIEIQGDVPDLSALNFNDAISSIVVSEGTWTLYENANYAGFSVTVSKSGGLGGAGHYQNPLAFGSQNDVFSSIRKNSDRLDWSTKPKIRLFRDADYLGGEVEISSPGNLVSRSLVDLGFNDAVSSVIVEGGTWCLIEHVDSGFCVTVSAHGGPHNDGRYPHPSWLGDRNDVFSRVRNVSASG